jgi:serine/threonine protein kinase
LIHRCGVEHRDFVPRNIVQKRGLYLKIIDFGFSNTDHVCPGWNVCMELQFAWRELLLDRVTSPFQHWMPGWFGLREVGNMNYYPTLLFTVGVILLAFIIVVIPTN